jgi:hypothetical protein
MIGIINIFYLVLFLGIAIIGLYICYHILRYSLSKGAAFVTVFVFASVFLFFLMTNAYSFFRVDWTGLLASPGIQTQFPSTYSRF